MRLEITYRYSWSNGIVPIRASRMFFQGKGSHILVADLQALFLYLIHEIGLLPETGSGLGGPDAVQHPFKGGERGTGPGFAHLVE